MTELIVYTDGGSKAPNGNGGPGWSGWGVHIATPDNVYNHWGSIPGESTNNIAEIVAATKGIQLAINLKPDSMIVRTDSTYVLKGVKKYLSKWSKNGWLLADGSPVKNKEYWIDLMAVMAASKTAGIDFNMEWVKGHRNSEGNIQADLNATKGRLLTENGHHGHSFEECDVPKAKPKTADYSRLFSRKCWYFMNDRPEPYLSKDGRIVYHCCNMTSLDLAGKPVSDAAQTVIFAKEENKILESLRTYVTARQRGKAEIIIAALDTIYTPAVFKELSTNGGMHFTYKDGATLLTTGEKLTVEASPPGKAFSLIDLLGNLEELLEKYVAGKMSRKHCITDITDEIYVPVKKKVKLRPEIGPTDTTLTLPVDYNTKTPEMAELIMVLGIDLPTRNALNRLATVDTKVKVITWPESRNGFRYATVIETADDVSIWVGSYSNLRVMG